MIYVLKTYIYYILYNLKKKIANTSLFLQKKLQQVILSNKVLIAGLDKLSLLKFYRNEYQQL